MGPRGTDGTSEGEVSHVRDMRPTSVPDPARPLSANTSVSISVDVQDGGLGVGPYAGLTRTRRSDGVSPNC